MPSSSGVGYTAFANVKPSAWFTLPPASFFKVPPSDIPRTLPPPPDHPTLAHPFTIPTELYNAALSPMVPTTIALVYVTVITYLNSVNKSRNHTPWAFSKTRMFKLLVLTHNVLLATYSLWTFVGMVNALQVSLYPPWHELGFAGTVDSLCKVNGPRGLGSAARYNETSAAWGIANRFFRLGADGLNPDVTDVGRLWNEGLAFYGWLFYLSKFYEVIDTLIIIAKGKRSSFLQTYHHAGAMLCMWAGIRYMSAPIWMFVLVNSFIHAIMYTFYFISATSLKVPVWLKRTLTTMQITQFVIGASYAFAHLFIKYQSPISVPYLYQLGDAGNAVASEISSAASYAATATASANLGAYAKKILLRAAGREGLAENILNDQGQTFGVDAIHPARGFVKRQETRYREELQWTHCLDTSGQTFAICLNVLYLAPLTWLFVRFFIKSYMQRLGRRRSSTPSQRAQLAIQSGRDASRGVGRRLSEAFEDKQGGINGLGDDVAIIDEEEVKTALNDVKQAASVAKMELDKATSGSMKGMSRALDDLKDKADLLKATAQNESPVALDKVEETYESVKAGIASSVQSLKGQISTNQIVNGVEKHEDRISSTSIIETVTESFQEKAEIVVDSIKHAVSDVPGIDVKLEDTNGEDESTQDGQSDHDAQPASDQLSQEEHPVTEPQKTEEDVSDADDADATDDKPDHGPEVAESKEKDDEATEGADADKYDQVLGPDEDVRSENLDEQSKAEPSTGDAKAAEPPANEDPTKDLTSKDLDEEDVSREDVRSTEEPDKEEPSLEDSSQQDLATQDLPSEEEQMNDSAGQSPQDQSASWVHVDREDGEDEEKDSTVEELHEDEKAASAPGANDHEHRPTPSDAEDKSDEVEEAPESVNREETTEHDEDNGETAEEKVPEHEAELADGSAHTEAADDAKLDEEHMPEDSKDEDRDEVDDSKESSYADVVAGDAKGDSEPKDDTEAQEPTEEPAQAQTAADSDVDKPSAASSEDNVTQDEAAETEPPEDTLESETKQTQGSSAEDNADSETRPTSPQSFENLTRSIDSKVAGVSEENEQDKAENDDGMDKKGQDETTAESEPVQDEVSDTQPTTDKDSEDDKADTEAEAEKEEQNEAVADPEPAQEEISETKAATDNEGEDDKADAEAEAEKEEQDQIIAESEPVRDDVSDTKPTADNDGEDDKADTEAETEKKEQDEIIADSGPVRDDVSDTEPTTDKDGEDDKADAEAELEKEEQNEAVADPEPAQEDVNETKAATDNETGDDKPDAEAEAEKEEQDEIVADSETVQEVVNETKAAIDNEAEDDKADAEAKEQQKDQITADSEPVQDDSSEKKSTIDDEDDKVDAEAEKKEQDQIIADSEPVRDEVADEDPATPANDKTAEVEVGSPKWHSKRRG